MSACSYFRISISIQTWTDGCGLTCGPKDGTFHLGECPSAGHLTKTPIGHVYDLEVQFTGASTSNHYGADRGIVAGHRWGIHLAPGARTALTNVKQANLATKRSSAQIDCVGSHGQEPANCEHAIAAAASSNEVESSQAPPSDSRFGSAFRLVRSDGLETASNVQQHAPMLVSVSNSNGVVPQPSPVRPAQVTITPALPGFPHYQLTDSTG